MWGSARCKRLYPLETPRHSPLHWYCVTNPALSLRHYFGLVSLCILLNLFFFLSFPRPFSPCLASPSLSYNRDLGTPSNILVQEVATTSTTLAAVNVSPTLFSMVRSFIHLGHFNKTCSVSFPSSLQSQHLEWVSFLIVFLYTLNIPCPLKICMV